MESMTEKNINENIVIFYLVLSLKINAKIREKGKGNIVLHCIYVISCSNHVCIPVNMK